jgi:hypothetical protein
VVILVVVAGLVHQLAGPRFLKLWDAMVLVACKFPLAKVRLVHVPCLMDRYAQYNALRALGLFGLFEVILGAMENQNPIWDGSFLSVQTTCTSSQIVKWKK